MKVIRTKTKWMRPYKLAELWGTTKQNINAMKNRGLIELKSDTYGNVLVRGIGKKQSV
ncbi:MAG: hypothetical protein V4547_17120 [Bacteroidota bacterium]